MQAVLALIILIKEENWINFVNMEDSELLILSFAFTFFGLLLILISPTQRKSALLTLLVIINSFLTSVPAVHALTGKPLNLFIGGLSPFGDIPIRIDALSAWFILIINFTCINGALYGMEYMKAYKEQKANLSMHWILFLLFHSSMVWVCMIQHSVAFLIAWELMSLSSLLLVIFDHQNKKTLWAGINYLIQMHIGVILLTSAFLWVYFLEGSFDFAAIEKALNSHSGLWLFFLFFAGFGIKAGFMFMHTWLPHAHPAAPSHISGVMSGVIVKLGIYGILRVAFMLRQDYFIIGQFILIFSIVTGLYGILNAAVHRDFKKMLAYCTIENIGIIGTGIGMGIIGMGSNNPLLVILGFGGALLHTLNHSLFKSLLFFSAGSVYQQTHTRDMEKLGGLAKNMPKTAFIFLIGALAISGLPPFNGFVSEFVLYSGYIEGIKRLPVSYSILMVISIACLAIIGGISMLTFTKSYGTIFQGNARTQLPDQPHETSFMTRFPQYLIILVMLSIGIFPQYYFSTVLNVVSASMPEGMVKNITGYDSLLPVISNVGRYSFIFLCLTLLVYLLRNRLMNKGLEKVNSTWGCGYGIPNVKMQYSGKSFSKPLAKLLNFVVLEKKKYKEISRNEIFPPERNYSSHYIDFFESNIINKVVDKIVYAANYFQFIQNGKIQAYVLYGIFFIILIFLGTIINIV